MPIDQPLVATATTTYHCWTTVHEMKARTGFTLIELIITIAVMAILLSLAAPAFTNMIRNNRVATQANDLVSALNYARSEAIRRGMAVSVCPSANASTCAGGTNWATGWVVFSDLNNDGQRNAGEPLLRVGQALSNGSTLVINTGSLVIFEGLGNARAQRILTLAVAGCDPAHQQARQITVTGVGRLETVAIDCP